MGGWRRNVRGLGPLGVYKEDILIPGMEVLFIVAKPTAQSSFFPALGPTVTSYEPGNGLALPPLTICPGGGMYDGLYCSL